MRRDDPGSAGRTGRRGTLVAVVVGLLALVAAAAWWWAPNRYLPWDTADLPGAAAGSSPLQRSVLEVLGAEHRAQRPGTFYSEGVDEEWCADFVSWVMREAGIPLENPHSGHWRIPGVYTLQEYYEAAGRYEPTGSGYRPGVGDVVLYRNRLGFGQHTNIVAGVDGDSVVTVGGNELGRIRVHELDLDDAAIVGYGRLPS